jgi:uncharacterized protein
MNQSSDRHYIVAFVSDLYFTVRILSVAERLGYEVVTIEQSGDVIDYHAKLNPHNLDISHNDIDLSLLDCVSRWKPVLTIFDLNNKSIPWGRWIKVLSSDPATRRFPIICFSSHKDLMAIDLAKRMGAKVVFARSRFVSNIYDIIKKFALLPDKDGLITACLDPLEKNGLIGIEKFNQGHYFEAHEYLELAWMNDGSSGRNLYRALLQVAVAYYQIIRGNYRGAFKMFMRMRQWIDILPERCRGVNIAKLRKEVDLVHEKLIELGPEKISELDQGLFHPIEYSEL